MKACPPLLFLLHHALCSLLWMPFLFLNIRMSLCNMSVYTIFAEYKLHLSNSKRA